MKTILPLLLIFSLVIPACTQTNTLIGDIDTFLENAIRTTGAPAAAMAITDAEGILYSRAFGDASEETTFHAASLSKAVTAVGVLVLAEEGLIDLDAPVTDALPEFALAEAGAAERITPRQLLTQTSGLADSSFSDLKTPGAYTLAEGVSLLADAPLATEPGTTFSYFNFNYLVLGRLIEVTSGQDFETFMAERVFAPLGMIHSGYERTDATANGSHIAFGMTFPGRSVLPYDLPAGSLVTTADDLGAFMQLFLNEGAPLLNAESIAQALTVPDGIDTSYAMGWFKGEIAGIPVYQHGGDLADFHADMILMPEQGYGIVLLYAMNNIPAQMSAIPATAAGIVSRLAGVDPTGPGLPVRIIGLVILVLTIVIIVDNIRKITWAKTWAAANKDKPLSKLAPSFVMNLFPLALFIALPGVIMGSLGRAATYPLMFAYLPDVMVLLLVSSLLGIWQLGARAIALKQVRS